MTNQDHTNHAQPVSGTPTPQAATPPASGSVGTPQAEDGVIEVVATGLPHPRGFTWGPDGALYVAIAGDGLTPPPGDHLQPAVRPEAPPSVVRIVDGEAVPVAYGLPSTQDPYGDVMGPVDVGFLGDQLYILQDAAGGVEDVGLLFPNGLYALERGESVRMMSSVTAFVGINPAENLYHVVPLGEPFAMVADEDEAGFWVLDANQGLVLHIHPDGTLREVADVSLGHPVPTAIARAPDGGVYVGFLGSGPHLDGTSKVIHVSADGEVTDFWTGLTMVTGLFSAPDGTLYALEMSTGNTAEPPNIYPNTGRVVRQTGGANLEEVVTGLNFPISMDIGPDGWIYISSPAIAAAGEMGSIIRVSPASGEAVRVPSDLLERGGAR